MTKIDDLITKLGTMALEVNTVTLPFTSPGDLIDLIGVVKELAEEVKKTQEQK
jgi:hypothetical protein